MNTSSNPCNQYFKRFFNLTHKTYYINIIINQPPEARNQKPEARSQKPPHQPSKVDYGIYINTYLYYDVFKYNVFFIFIFIFISLIIQ
jgi:hypothetical protein